MIGPVIIVNHIQHLFSLLYLPLYFDWEWKREKFFYFYSLRKYILLFYLLCLYYLYTSQTLETFGDVSTEIRQLACATMPSRTNPHATFLNNTVLSRSLLLSGVISREIIVTPYCDAWLSSLLFFFSVASVNKFHFKPLLARFNNKTVKWTFKKKLKCLLKINR